MQPTFVRRQPSEPRCATNPLRPRVQPPLIRPLPCQNNGCSSGEMRDLVFLDRVSARLNLISRGDVVVLRSPDDDALITKRVVAMGGETVRHREHGSRLVRVPTAHLWVEGDNGEVGLAVKKSGPSLGFSWSSALDPILGPSCGVAGRWALSSVPLGGFALATTTDRPPPSQRTHRSSLAPWRLVRSQDSTEHAMPPPPGEHR